MVGTEIEPTKPKIKAFDFDSAPFQHVILVMGCTRVVAYCCTTYLKMGHIPANLIATLFVFLCLATKYVKAPSERIDGSMTIAKSKDETESEVAKKSSTSASKKKKKRNKAE